MKIMPILAVVSLAASCATGSLGIREPVLRPAVDAPDQFFVQGETVWTGTASACRSPLEDPRDGTRLLMQRAAGGMADYSVPAGRYGIGEDELLRVSCSTGGPVGVVRR